MLKEHGKSDYYISNANKLKQTQNILRNMVNKLFNEKIKKYKQEKTSKQIILNKDNFSEQFSETRSALLNKFSNNIQYEADDASALKDYRCFG